MIEVKLDRDYYSKMPDITKWLRKHMGPMDYNEQQVPATRWAYSQIFGYTTIVFRDEADATAFKAKWIKNGDANG
jgi:hypothetical protein